MQEIANLSEESSTNINSSSIADYYSNHFDNTSTINKAASAIFSVKNSELVSSMIKKLSEYQAKNNRLPLGFDEVNVRKFYIKT